MKLQYLPILFTTALSAWAQSAVLTPIAAAPGAYNVEMPPEPEWKPLHSGLSLVRLTVQVPGAAACRLSFAWLGLGEGEQMFVHAAGRIAHGPYLGHGPVSYPGFDSQWLPGGQFTIVAAARPGTSFPFLLEQVRCLSPDELAAASIAFEQTFVPSRPAPAGPPVLALFEDQLVTAHQRGNATVLQGDIVIASETASKSSTRASNQIVPVSRSWPNFRIPYVLKEYAGSDHIESAINTWNQQFPGLFVPRTTEKDFITLRVAAGVCQSSVGRIGGEQFIDLDYSCNTGAVVHELGHTIGLWHEHIRQDRDQFLKIMWENIDTTMFSEFTILSSNWASDFGAYDRYSVMHYNAYAYSSNGKQTIVPLFQSASSHLGTFGVPTDKDVASVRNLICNHWLTPPAAPHLDGGGDTVTFTVNLPPYCPWTATESSPWLTLNKTSGTGPAVLQIKAPPSTSKNNRVATLYVNGKGILITQEGNGF